MEMQNPFVKKKKKSQKEIKKEIEKLKEQIEIEEKALMDRAIAADSIAARMAKFHLLNIGEDKKTKNIVFKPGDHGTEQESFEKFQHRVVPTEFIDPHRRFRLVLEYANFNIEQTYYWFLRYFNESWGFDKVEKVIDTLAASAASSNFGNLQSRLGAQQAQASQYLKGISEMIKGLFQIVREVRVLDERLAYYYDSDGDKDEDGKFLGDPKLSLGSEIVLKGLWIDQVEGGAKNPGSVYGLAQTIGFTILPDVFFRTQIKNRSSMQSEIDKLNFNKKVKEVLYRKLRQYYEWKDRTKQELKVRRQFSLNYLKQHYDVIRLYMSWVKPYLRNIRRLQLYEKNMENPHIIHAFETQIIELETLFIRTDANYGHAAPVISLHIFFRVKPELAFHSYEYQNKGAIYTGMADITLRAYTWDHDTIEHYKKYRTEDDLDLMAEIDNSIKVAMDSLGADLTKYLEEAKTGKKKQEEEEEQPPDQGFLEPFLSIFDGFKEIVTSFSGNTPKKKTAKKKKEKAKEPERKEIVQHERAHHFAVEACWEAYYRYKMGPGGNIYWVE